MGDRAAQSQYTYRGDREASQRNILWSVSLCSNGIPLCASRHIFVNIKLVYLFSNHFGLLVNLLPIGHITQEVMALCSWETNLFSCFFQALFCSAPQDHLAKKITFLKGWKETETCSALKLGRDQKQIVWTVAYKWNKKGCFYSQSSTKHYVGFAQFFWQWDLV